jgi:hypothetical protein
MRSGAFLGRSLFYEHAVGFAIDQKQTQTLRTALRRLALLRVRVGSRDGDKGH